MAADHFTFVLTHNLSGTYDLTLPPVLVVVASGLLQRLTRSARSNRAAGGPDCAYKADQTATASG